MVETLERAVELFRNNPREWLALQRRAMKQDFSWNASARAYIELLGKMIQA